MKQTMKQAMEQSTKQTTPRQIDVLLSKYSESHQHPTNEIIHFICVPAIVFSLLGLIWAMHPFAAWATIAVSLLYYLTLSLPFTFGMLLMSAAMLGILTMLPQAFVWQISLAVFVIAWIGQFIGHNIERRKPSFFDDVRFLMIGPLFVLSFLYRRLRIAY